MGPESLGLADWDTFYVITGGAASGFAALMFAVVAFTTERQVASSPVTLSAFVTPSVVHFSVVLAVAAFARTPGQTASSLAICLGASAVFGLGYSIRVVARIRRQRDYPPVAADWVWYVVLPVLAYIGLFTSAVSLRRDALRSLQVTGAAVLLLLFAGIHNAWDSATWSAMHPRTRK
jgi:hypothetical protein